MLLALASEVAIRMLLTTYYHWPCKGSSVEAAVKQFAEHLVGKGHDELVSRYAANPEPPLSIINNGIPAVHLTHYILKTASKEM